METKVITFKSQKAIDIINQEKVLAFPTETVFGFGIRYDSRKAFDELCKLKGRQVDKPFTIMVSSKKDINQFVNLNDKMKRLIDKFMPGEITILFPAKKDLDEHLTLKQDTVGIRISSKKEVTDLIKRVGKPMLVTSANYSSKPPLLDEESVIEEFNHKIEAVVKGKCTSFIPSTIVKIDQENLILIRKGSIPFEDIMKEWKK